MSRVTGLILSTLLVFAPCEAASQGGLKPVTVVKSSDNAYYDQTIETLIRHVDENVIIQVLKLAELDGNRADSQQENLYIALGQAAVKAVDKLDTVNSSLNAYLTREQYAGLQPGDRQLTVLLDQPLHRYLAFSKLLLDVDRIGVITPGEINLTRRQTSTLKAFELTLDQHRIGADNKLLPVLRNLLRQDDALLMLPRQKIYNHDTLKGVLLTSYRSRKPVVSYSPAHVKSGAVASIYSSPTDIGRHLALLVNEKLQNRLDPGSGFVYPRFYSIAANSRVAHALGITLPDRQTLRARLDGLEK